MLSQTHHSTTATSLRRHCEMDGAAFEKKKGSDELSLEFDVGDFSVDDLLDFPETNEAEVVGGCEGDGTEDGVSVTLPCFSVKFDGVGGFSPSEISVPADDVAELEWLSTFVDDSFTEYSFAYSGANLYPKPVTVTPAVDNACRLFPPPLKKSRGKRCRSSGKSWSLSNSSDSASSSSSSNSTSPIPSKRKRGISDGGGVRRCSHCGVQKTPQWRAGPEGAKTLCNACGVRFKSGRLVPEYRPACSPTFCSEVHSNQHRKVVEMRRKKEVGTAASCCLAPVV